VITLRPVNLRWIQGAADDPADLCAHGEVEFRIGDDVLLDPAATKELTVSAAALYLLRTLATPHTREAPVGDQLFPCCGFAMYEVVGQQDVVVCGCPHGEDFEVLHRPDGAGVVVRAPDGREWTIAWPDWRAAVFAFADAVTTFYASCSPKQPAPDDEAGFRCFLAEWARRRA
jgi:hypothetical protein